MIGVDKVAVLSNAIESWRERYGAMSLAIVANIRHRAKSRAERKDQAKSLEEVKVRRSTALACMAASLLLHDRAVIEQRARREKVKADFERAGMFLPGFRYQWVGDRPVAIPLESPLVVKSPHANAGIIGI